MIVLLCKLHIQLLITSGEEAQNPRRTIPLAICLCLFVVFLAYSGIAAVLTLIWPYYLHVIKTPTNPNLTTIEKKIQILFLIY